MKRFLTVLSAIMLLSACTHPDPVTVLADKVFDLAAIQYAHMDDALGNDGFPKCTGKDGNLVTSDKGWWCSGFYPGSLWYIYEYTGDERFKELAWKHTRRLESLQYSDTDHDIGFQINCSYGNGMRLTGDSTYVDLYVRCAHILAGRFTPQTGVTKSWNFLRKNWRYPVIIDNMMNLELLTKAAEISGDRLLEDVAISHAMTTLKNHFRQDWSSWHLVDYDPESGAVRSRETVQGYSDDSAWARGQAWALYGYTMMYRETGREEFLDAAENIGDMIIGRLPEDGIPYWDFDDPSIPETFRDASAGAIMASAFIELSTLTDDGTRSEYYLDTARRQILTLGSEEYLATPGSNAGFILKHSVGNIPGGTEIDVALSYADYYFLEALVRYSDLSDR
ncbi:MAG: glycoside hydrolase family 88 protein [Bacteroidales bacterium]|nr:glycoside hydrolase family 88 protein [Bacteroidales bacterium]